MTDLLEDRLTDLFDRVGDAVVVEDRLDRVADNGALEPLAAGPRKRPWMLVAAAAVVLVGAAGVVRVASDRDNTVVQQPVEPPEPLYVLPSDLPGWTSRNGSTTPGSTWSYQGIVFGIPVDGMFINPTVVTLTPGPPERFSTETWREVSYNGELVFMSLEYDALGRTTVTQQSDAGWLTSSSRDPAPSVGALEAVEVDPAGNLVLTAPGFEVIASYDIASGLTVESTYSEAHGPDDEYVVVETSSGEIPLLAGVGDRASHLEPITVNGDAAWHISGTDVDGDWHAIVWEFAPQQGVFVSNHDSFDTLLAVAESLEVVDEATWTEATS